MSTTGRVRGAWVEGVAAFTRVPFAAPPVGALRWAPPRPHPGWTGTRDVSGRGPAAPQVPSRLDDVMGPMTVGGYAEDSLTLAVWSPTLEPNARLPVMVWHHGGRLVAGAGSATWFDGAELARRGNVVVVSVNHRLGALGYLYLPAGTVSDEPVANLGLQDQLAAWRWVHRNIAEFGGDPNTVTAFGQSAGGASILALLGLPEGRELVTRAIVQSAPLGAQPLAPDIAEAGTRAFLDEAGIAMATVDVLRDLPVERILAAQGATMRRLASRVTSASPFATVRDDRMISELSPVVSGTGRIPDVDLVIGATSGEARAYWAFDDAFWEWDAQAMAAFVGRIGGAEVEAAFRSAATDDPRAPADVAVDLFGRLNVIGPTEELARRWALTGAATYGYCFGWPSTAAGGRLGACHTIELPFVFGNAGTWAAAPMMEGFTPGAAAELAEIVQGLWTSFAVAGDPGRRDWPRLSGPRHPVLQLGPEPTVVEAGTP